MTARRTLSQADLDVYAQLSGDHNPIHVDPAFAAHTRFGATVAHGMLLFSLVRAQLEQHYPGAAMHSQHLTFPAPAYTQQSLEISLVIQGAAAADELAIRTRITRPDGQRCLEGDCVLHLAPSPQ
ncbi:MaoC/PaaZ C-terminal domain-containing protein [Salinisphaera orenii]|uniref:MaoC/PaaZ C-terminal domain-containing protein n=1 Tax=Salinisphaera orenii TaxID=856731 RepID=UPI001C82C2EE|nr:MaoC/PaaZ C-terminal domain-containing protein [Salinisphaera halophila]